MNIDACFYLGYSQKTIGTQGELALKLDVDSPSSYENLDHILIQIQQKDQMLVPFFIEKSSLQSKGLLRCKLDGINTQAEANQLIGKSIFLPLDRLPKLKGNQFYFHEIIGFQVKDDNYGELGVVTQVLEYPGSNLLVIDSQGTEVLIPINNETVPSIDRENKRLITRAPDGLIELYLEG